MKKRPVARMMAAVMAVSICPTAVHTTGDVNAMRTASGMESSTAMTAIMRGLWRATASRWRSS